MVYVNNSDASSMLGMQLYGTSSMTSQLNQIAIGATEDTIQPAANYYQVVIQELGLLGQQHSPGAGLASTSLRIIANSANLACRTSLNATSLLPSLAAPALSIYLGCPPHQQLVFDADASRQALEQCDNSDGIPCVSYAFEFDPILYILNEVSSTSVLYNDEFTFTIVAGGE